MPTTRPALLDPLFAGHGTPESCQRLVYERCKSHSLSRSLSYLLNMKCPLKKRPLWAQLTALQRVEDALVVLENAISLSPGVFVLYFTHGNVLAV